MSQRPGCLQANVSCHTVMRQFFLLAAGWLALPGHIHEHSQLQSKCICVSALYWLNIHKRGGQHGDGRTGETSSCEFASLLTFTVFFSGHKGKKKY